MSFGVWCCCPWSMADKIKPQRTKVFAGTIRILYDSKFLLLLRMPNCHFSVSLMLGGARVGLLAFFFSLLLLCAERFSLALAL